MFPALRLPVALFLSGAAGLIFQVVWFHRCGLVLGSGMAAITIVLSSFMSGLAAGNALAALYGGRVSRHLRAYALLEALVALTGVAVSFGLTRIGPVLGALVQAVGHSGVGLNLARFAIAFVMLVVPAIAMGATLPILVDALSRRGDQFGAALGRLYGWNTLGAVAGVVVGESVLIGTVGIAGAAWLAAALNLSAAALVFSLSLTPHKATNSTPMPALPDGECSGAPPWLLYAATALSGAQLLALEVVWFRVLSMYVIVTTLATSLMLAVVLAGIGLGGHIAAIWARRDRDLEVALPAIACALGVTVIGSFTLFQAATAGAQVGAWQSVLWFACVLTLPASCLSGVLFTLTGIALHRAGRTASAAAGWLSLANTAGAICGPPFCAYVLLPFAGVERSIFGLALTYGGVAALAARAVRAAASHEVRTSSARAVGFTAAIALLIGLVVIPFVTKSGSHFQRAAAPYVGDGSAIVATREGPSETLFVMQQQWLGKPVYSRLITNGFSMSGTALQGQRYMRAFAYYPMLLHEGPLRRALVICYGVGVTVGAVADIPTIESIDVAEISRDVVAMSDAIYPAGERPLEDPRVRLHIEDGRFLLQTTRERFDLITGEPPPPRTPGTVNIYTREYFQLVYDRLAEGGLATYWVPVARPQPGTDVNTVIRAFCDVFSDCSLWNATPFDLMLVGSRGGRGPRAAETLSKAWQTPGLEARLREVGFERVEQIGATFVGDAEYLRELTAGTPPLVDDFPQRLRPAPGRPSLSDPRYGTDPAATRMYQSTLDPARARAAFARSPWVSHYWPLSLRDRTLPYFDVQAIVNRVYWEGGHPLRQIEDLDRVLSTTTLRTLPLWILGSDEVKQRIAEGSDDTSGGVLYARALRALSGRDFAGAARLLDASSRAGLQGRTIRPLLAYALAKSAQLDGARHLTTSAQPVDDDERHFWQWLEAFIQRA